MSNRKKTPAEKARRPRCHKCKSKDIVLKEGYGMVCTRCGAPSSRPRP